MPDRDRLLPTARAVAQPPEPILSNLPRFRPARWMAGPHAQTILGRLLRKTSGATFRRERLDTPDADFVDLDFIEVDGFREVARDATAPIVLLLHGLEGNSHTGYAYEAYRALAREGLRVVAMNFRSCSGVPNRTARFYHSGETGDLDVVVRMLADRFPDVPRGAIAFSLGGNVLLKYLGERGSEAREYLHAAAAVSVPFDLAGGADKLERGMGGVYTWFFLRKLRRKLHLKRGVLEREVDLRAALRARTIREIDDRVTAPIHGFDDASDYYARSSCDQFLASIRIPALIVHAEDDPFVPAQSIPHDCAESNPWIETNFTRHGGHVGFVSGRPWSPSFWAEAEAAAYLRCRLSIRSSD